MITNITPALQLITRQTGDQREISEISARERLPLLSLMGDRKPIAPPLHGTNEYRVGGHDQVDR